MKLFTTCTSQLAIALCAAFLCSCAAVPEGGGKPGDTHALDEAARLQKSAGNPSGDIQRFMVYHLRAAEIASAGMKNGNRARARAINEASTVAVANATLSENPGSARKRFSYEGVSFDLSVATGRGIVPPTSLVTLKPASQVPRTLLKIWEDRPGVGVPLAAKWKSPSLAAQAAFASDRGFIQPVTALLDFSGKGQARISLLDPTLATGVTINRHRVPLAADFSAPIVDRTRDVKEVLLALEGLLHPDVRDARLLTLQPYDPEKTPVVLIHGLLSHPRMWKDVINELMGDPKIAANYQFWVYYYPTGWPIAYSAMRLRDELAAADKAFGGPKNIVLVGHSMGGLLARMQAISPGETFMRMAIPPSGVDKFLKLPADHIGKKSLLFHANPAIERIVFISTPHRGSKMADWSATTWLTKFVHLPSKITSAAVDFLPSLVQSPEKYASITRLSPTNPLYKVLESLPIQAPCHSIIGDRGRGDSPNSSDGVVPYSSSHLAAAESEVIVPDDHGAFDDPKAITELKRILIRNLKAR